MKNFTFKPNILGYSLMIILAFVFVTNPLMAFNDTAIATMQGGASVLDILKGFLVQYFVSQVAFATLTVVVAAYMIKIIGSTTSLAKQGIALGTSVALALGGQLLGLGIFSELTIPASLLMGLQIGFSSNGVFDIYKSITD